MTSGLAPAVPVIPNQPVRNLLRHLRTSKLGIIGVVMTFGFVCTALFGPYLPFVRNQPSQALRDRLQPPLLWGGSWHHPLGTDQLGRDLLARLIEAGRVSVFVGASAVALSALVGVTLGLIAGYRGGWFDSLLMGLSDVQIAIPGVLLGIMLVAAFGASVRTVVLIIFLSGWVVFARVTRGQVLTLKTQLFVEAGELSGSKPSRMMRVHLLPNLWSSLLTLAVLEFSAAILTESAFSFLGFGVKPPQSSWGLIIAQGRTYVTNGWWIVTFGGMAIAVAVFGTNLVALWLQSYGHVAEREQILLGGK